MTPPPIPPFRRGRDSDRSRERTVARGDHDRPARRPGRAAPSTPEDPANGDVPEQHPDGGAGAAQEASDASGQGAGTPSPQRRSSRTAVVARAVERWVADLTALGAEGLGDDDDLGEAVLDLTHAHPGGTAQLYAGRPTRLSNLVRERNAAVAAHQHARLVRARAEDLAQRFGVAPTYLATGVATWSALPPPVVDGDEHDADLDPTAPPAGRRADEGAEAPLARTIRTPVFLRGVRLQPVSADGEVELTLERAVELNPVLARALTEAGLPGEPTDHLPALGPASSQREALAGVAELAARYLPGLEIEDRVVVGTFLHPGQVAVEDLKSMVPHLASSDVVAALAGDLEARSTLATTLPPDDGTDPDPDEERAVGDVEVAGERAVRLVTQGYQLVVDAPPGADDVGVVAAILAASAADGRTVAYVPGDRRTGRSTVAHLHELGLGELVLDLRADGGWREEASRSIRRGMEAPAVTVDQATVARTREELRATRAGVREQLDSLHRRHDGWGVSLFDALQALARLTARTPGPRTGARISGEDLRALTGDARRGAAVRLSRAAILGAFTLRRSSTPWYGARLTTNQQAADALDRVQRLTRVELPAVDDLVQSTAVQTGLRRATTLREWREQLAMLDGVADALDVFLPQIFEHSAADMVAATAPRNERRSQEVELSAGMRRRLTRQARDLVRPGRSVTDLHAELLRVQEQREIWRRHSTGGGWPRLPDGLADIRELERETSEDVAALGAVLEPDDDTVALEDLDLAELRRRIDALEADTTALRTLPERTRLVDELRAEGLGELVDDLVERAVPDDLVADELDLAWWSSVLEQVLADEPALAGRDPAELTADLADLERREAEQRATLVPAVRSATADRLRRAVRTHRTQAAHLWEQLAADRGATLGRALADHPEVAPTIRPVRAAAPLLVAQIIPPGPTVDLVVLHGTELLPLAQVASVAGRARQVVVVGDVRRHPGGATHALAEVLPAVELPAVRGPLVPGAARLLATHGYEDSVAPVPSVRPDGGVRLELVEGYGTPPPGEEVVESVDAEVRAVVDAVSREVHDAPLASIAVVTPSPRHASRVREALSQAAAEDPGLEAALDPRLVEPLVVADLADAGGLRRDVVVLSVGFGANAHGRFVHRFGDLSGPDGRTRMVTALAAPRESLVVVSTIGPGAIDRTRIHHEGAHMLAELLDLAGGAGTVPDAGAPADAAGGASGGTEVAGEQAVGAPPAGEAGPDPEVVAGASDGSTTGTERASAPDAEVEHAASSGADAEAVAAERPTDDAGVDPGATARLDAVDGGAVDAEDDGDERPVAEDLADPVAGEAAHDDDTPDDDTPDPVPAWLREETYGEVRAAETTGSPEEDTRDEILGDLVRRLRRLGLVIEEDLRGAVDVPLALGHPDLPGQRLVAVLTDAGEDAGEHSLRRRLDRGAVLARAGWRVERAFTVSIFLDPQAEADRLRRVVLDEVAARRGAYSGVSPAAPATGTDADDVAGQGTDGTWP
ncbi:hypothetical protein ACPYO6_08695 [Georgenia sp. Z1344]|uniref:hypothetical protein n=1 Tax=Georgenia sp. Z1344 TaxID=3416706 RepID=UPI003CFAF8BE